MADRARRGFVTAQFNTEMEDDEKHWSDPSDGRFHALFMSTITQPQLYRVSYMLQTSPRLPLSISEHDIWGSTVHNPDMIILTGHISHRNAEGGGGGAD